MTSGLRTNGVGGRRSVPGGDNGCELRLWQLVSPALPVGAYAYSHGLESAVTSGWVSDLATARAWIVGLLEHSVAALDVPVLVRLYAAWQCADHAAVRAWSEYLRASRETCELQAEDRDLGRALARLLDDLGVSDAAPWRDDACASFLALFALAAAHWRIPPASAARAYCWTWGEHQVAAAVKLVPLGQTDGQRLLGDVIEAIPAALEDGLALNDEDIGASAPALGIASAWHETQYSRLFRS